MTEIMLHDTAAAHDLNYVVLRYFNVAGADPQTRIGLSTMGATHLLKIRLPSNCHPSGGRDRRGSSRNQPR